MEVFWLISTESTDVDVLHVILDETLNVRIFAASGLVVGFVQSLVHFGTDSKSRIISQKYCSNTERNIAIE